MCEEEPPVKALKFLQTQVASAVDHNNAKETEIFRSLLTHLLSPSPAVAPTSPSDSRPSTSSGSTVSSVEHEDTRETSPRPIKRSRAGKESTESGVWTSEISPAAAGADVSPSFLVGGTERLKEVTDPLEALFRGEDAQPTLSGPRYSQRTEVFENILSFISENEKQPTGSLLDLVEKDRCRIIV